MDQILGILNNMKYPVNLPEILRTIRSNPYLKDLPDEAFGVPLFTPPNKDYTEQNIYIKNLQKVLIRLNFQFKTNSFSIHCTPMPLVHRSKEVLPISLLSETISEVIKSIEIYFLNETSKWKISAKPLTLKKEAKENTIKYLGLTELFKDIPDQATSFYSSDSEIQTTSILQANHYNTTFSEQLFSILLIKSLNKKPKLFIFFNNSKENVQIKTKKALGIVLSSILSSKQMKQWKHNWICKVAKQELLDLLPLSKTFLSKITLSNFHYERNTDTFGSRTTESLCLGHKTPIFILQKITTQGSPKILYSINYKPSRDYEEKIYSDNINIFKEKLHLLFLSKNLLETFPGIKAFLPTVFNKEAILNSILNLESGNSFFSGMPVEAFNVEALTPYGHKITLANSNSKFCIIINNVNNGNPEIYLSNGSRICSPLNSKDSFNEILKQVFDLDRYSFIKWIRVWSMNNLYQDRYFH
jgi:hypothetical protein